MDSQFSKILCSRQDVAPAIIIKIRWEQYQKYPSCLLGLPAYPELFNHICRLECQSSKDKNNGSSACLIYNISIAFLSTLLLNRMISGKLNFRQ